MLAPEESLQARIEADAALLQRLSLDATELGGRLAALLAAARESDWFLPATEGGLAVEIHRRRGIATCPWAPEEHESCGRGDGGRRAGANQFLIRNASTGASLEGWVLGAHLIAEHGFFGGVGTRFRVEPVALAALLGQA
jgi:hypothetical protein